MHNTSFPCTRQGVVYPVARTVSDLALLGCCLDANAQSLAIKISKNIAAIFRDYIIAMAGVDGGRERGELVGN